MLDYVDSSIKKEPLTLPQLCTQIAQNAAKIDHEGYFPVEEFEYMKNTGLLAITLPGNSLSFEQNKTAGLLKLLKQIGKASLPVGRIYEGHINALYLIHLFGLPAQQQRWFADAAIHKKLFGVWNTQDASGVKIHDLGNGKYKLEGTKMFCSGAGWIQRPLITGELISPKKRGWQMCVIPTEKVKALNADSSFWKPLGMRASASFRMDFTGVELNENDLLGNPGSYYEQPYFGGGAIRFAAVQLGGAEAILEETHQFLKSVKRTDDPFQRARMAELTYLIETGNLWVNQAGLKTDEWLNKPGTADQIIAYANMTRTVIEDICLKALQLAEKSVGSRGLMRPHPLERIHRDLTTYLRQPAPDATLTAIGEYVLNQKTTNKLWNDDRT